MLQAWSTQGMGCSRPGTPKAWHVPGLEHARLAHPGIEYANMAHPNMEDDHVAPLNRPDGDSADKNIRKKHVQKHELLLLWFLNPPK